MKKVKALVTVARTNGGSYIVEDFSIVTKGDVINFTRALKTNIFRYYDDMVVAVQSVIHNNSYYVNGYEMFGTTFLDIFIRYRNGSGYSRISADTCGAKCWKVVN